MAHVPERTELYVCTNCQVVSAGTIVHVENDSHRFEEPPHCGAWGESDFVEMGQYPRTHRSRW